MTGGQTAAYGAPMSTLGGMMRALSRPAGDRPAPSASDLNWLRAGVLGANDGIVSIAATVLGVAAAAPNPSTIALGGGAALLAGAMSMAAGEYVSVSSQRDAELRTVARAEAAGGGDGKAEVTNPWHAAVASFGAFTLGGLVPMLVVLAPWGSARIVATFTAVVLALVVTGLLSARFSGGPHRRSVVRNVLGGSLAMALTMAVGAVVGPVL